MPTTILKRTKNKVCYFILRGRKGNPEWECHWLPLQVTTAESGCLFSKTIHSLLFIILVFKTVSIFHSSVHLPFLP